MSKQLDDQLRRVHEPFARDHDRLREELMASLPAHTPEPVATGWVRSGWQWIGENKMRRRILATSAIAASLVLVVLGFWPGEGGNGRLYAFADIPAMLDATRTIHFEGRGYVTVNPEPPDDMKWFPKETWLDLENGRSRSLFANFGVICSDSGPEWWVAPIETVIDGQYRMTIDHTEKKVSFERVSPYEHLLSKRRAANGLFAMMFGSSHRFWGLSKIGEESIGDVAFDVWEGEATPAGYKEPAVKTKCWLSPKTGTIGRIHAWGRNLPEVIDEQKWAHIHQLELIERNVPLPADIFNTDPPTGYEVTGDKTSALLGDLDDEGGVRVNNLEIDIRVSFTLDDGSVIVAWRGLDRVEPADEAHIFSELEVGGPLPKLPVQLVGLKLRGCERELTYEGRHLAWTHKNGKFIEWAICVPRAEPPDRASFEDYQVLHRFNPADRLENGQMTARVRGDIIITRDDFDTFVQGAMVELSDDGRPPAHVTYDNVAELSKDIRESLAAETSLTDD